MREVATTIGLHLYQPPRAAFHADLQNINTDPTGIDWTERILGECYKPLLQTGVLSVASFDLYGSLRHRISQLDPLTHEGMLSNLAENGVGDPYLHPILPDLSDTDKRILISAGYQQFEKDAGIAPKIFWAPETALDYSTLSVLAEVGYEGFICAPEQVYRESKGRSDNRPVAIKVDGRQIIALPFDRPISQELAFHPKTNADSFVRDVFGSAKGRTDDGAPLLIAWTDGETFGHHNKRAVRFIEYLLKNSLPQNGFIPMSANALISSLAKVEPGYLVERSAWSCPHGDLVRWHGECECSGNHDASWKSVFYDALHRTNAEVSDLVGQQMPDYTDYLSFEFENALTHEGGVGMKEASLLAAKASSLAAVTSCGTYFEDPHVSGNINVLFAVQACLHLHEAGFPDEADAMLKSLVYRLRWMPAWTYLGHAGTVIGDLLEGKMSY